MMIKFTGNNIPPDINTSKSGSHNAIKRPQHKQHQRIQNFVQSRQIPLWIRPHSCHLADHFFFWRIYLKKSLKSIYSFAIVKPLVMSKVTEFLTLISTSLHFEKY